MAQIWSINDLYGEDDDERAERLAAGRRRAWCSTCGAGNPKLGYACLPTCPVYVPAGEPR